MFFILQHLQAMEEEKAKLGAFLEVSLREVFSLILFNFYSVLFNRYAYNERNTIVCQ